MVEQEFIYLEDERSNFKIIEFLEKHIKIYKHLLSPYRLKKSYKIMVKIEEI